MAPALQAPATAEAPETAWATTETAGTAKAEATWATGAAEAGTAGSTKKSTDILVVLSTSDISSSLIPAAAAMSTRLIVGPGARWLARRAAASCSRVCRTGQHDRGM